LSETATPMTRPHELFYKSSATERYESDMNDKVREHLENAGVAVTGEFGGTTMGIAADDPTASDNGFNILCDEETALRMGNEIAELLDHRDVYVQVVTTGG
jgi:hypothetical protein